MLKEPAVKIKKTVKKTFHSLRTRNFRLFFAGQMISNTGNWLTNVALTLLVLKITNGSGSAIGWLVACEYGPILLLSAWAGSLVDGADKRGFLILTQTLEMLQSVALAVMAFMPHPPLAGFYIIAVFGGVFLAFDNPLRRSFVSEMVPKEDIPNAVVLYSTIINASRIFGPALAGFLVVTVGYGWCFTVDALSYIAVIIGLILMRSSELYRLPKKPKERGAVRAGIRYIRSVPSLWISFVMLAIIGIFSYNFSVTMPLFITDGLHQSTAAFTFVYCIFSAGAVVCTLVVAHKGWVRMKHIVWGAFALGCSMIIFAVSPNVPFAACAAFIVGVASILYTTSTTAMVQLESKGEMLGRVLALQTVLMIGTTPIGGPLLGSLADATNARVPIILGAVIALGAATFGYYASRKYPSLPDAGANPSAV